jgi:hypothetical protein
MIKKQYIYKSPMTGLEYLDTLHTKQLMNLRKEYKRFLFTPGWGNLTFDIPGGTVTVNISEINQVLSDRPHIPRCSETKRIRQIAAKSKVRSYQSSN